MPSPESDADAAPEGAPPDSAFAPPAGATWRRVSPRLTWLRSIGIGCGAVVTLAAGGWVAGRVLGTPAVVIVVAVVVVAAGIAAVLAARNTRSWGYVERADDLVVTHGVLLRRLVVIPYGRMQFVDVSANPLERWLGIATVRVYTAAATTEARIPGITAGDATALRDRLAERGEVRSMGL